MPRRAAVFLAALLALAAPYGAASELGLSAPAAVRPSAAAAPLTLAAPPAVGYPLISSAENLGITHASAGSVSLPPSAVVETSAGVQPLENAGRTDASAAALAASQVPAAASGSERGEAWSAGAGLFDGWRARGAEGLLGAAAVSAVAPSAVSGVAHAAALAPAALSVSYIVANVSSVVFPLPETYAAFRSGHAEEFPFWRAALGGAGALALGLVNAVVLDKPLWGVMHAFIGLGMIAPYFIGRWLRRRGELGPAYAAPGAAEAWSTARVWAHRLRHDAALRATLWTGAGMLAASAALYVASAAAVPAWLTAHLAAQTIADLLLGIQIAKGLMFIVVFAPDIVALARGQAVRGFSVAFTATFFVSVAAFTVWGFAAALLADPGPLREQYLVHGLRNLGEMVASGLSLLALLRARRSNRP